jgi:putative proteasome-type protease
MTYCVGFAVADGLVLLSDTRTNAGVDNISIFSKMHAFQIPDERFLVLLTAGNLAISQAVINLVHEGIENEERVETLYTVQTPFRGAQLIGEAVRRVYASDGRALQAQNVTFDASVLLAGEIRGRSMRMFQIYSAGNFIEATPDTPFLQIGAQIRQAHPRSCRRI